jgi:hypothetical protein
VAGRPDRWPGFHEVDGDESAVISCGIRLDKGIAGRSPEKCSQVESNAMNSFLLHGQYCRIKGLNDLRKTSEGSMDLEAHTGTEIRSSPVHLDKLSSTDEHLGTGAP